MDIIPRRDQRREVYLRPALPLLLSSLSGPPCVQTLPSSDMAASANRERAPTPSTPLLSTFQKHVEDMRSLVLCKICIKPLYEPYILGCGHTYCYTCLANWFGGATNRRKRKNCPDCRAHVSVQPSPNYLVRPQSCASSGPC